MKRKIMAGVIASAAFIGLLVMNPSLSAISSNDVSSINHTEVVVTGNKEECLTFICVDYSKIDAVDESENIINTGAETKVDAV